MSPQDIPNKSSNVGRINLGNDPGILIATIPALMGFTPRESLILVGLYNTGQGKRVMRIGPVVRTDLEPDSLARGLASFIDSMEGLDIPEVALVYISEDRDLLHEVRIEVEIILGKAEIGINGIHFTDRIAEGQQWYFPDGTVGGKIGNVKENPLQVMSKCNGAVQLDTWEERSAWLDPIHPRLNCTAEVRGMNPELSFGEAMDLITTLGEVINEIETGQITLAKAIEDEMILRVLARLSMDDYAHTVIVLFAQGMVNPAVRDLLAETARRTRGSIRCRVMLVLSLVLSCNDEGSLAFYTLARLQDELSELPRELNQMDESGQNMARLMAQMHQKGTVRLGIRAILVVALEYLVDMNADALNGICRYCDHECCEDELCEGEYCDCVACEFYAFSDYEELRPREDFASREEMMDWYVERALFCFQSVIREESLQHALDALEWAAIDRALTG